MGWVLRNFKTRDHITLKTLWKSIIQPNIDYCSPLWLAPSNIGHIRAIENLQRSYSKKFAGLGKCNYWDRLKCLRLLSQERRIERYRIIYTWKMLEDLIPNCGLTTHYSSRRGRLVNIKPINTSSSARVISIREGSFMINGPKLFNALPPVLRDISNCSVDVFKSHLDKFLMGIPDEPICDNLKPNVINQVTGRFSNSLIDQIRHKSLNRDC